MNALVEKLDAEIAGLRTQLAELEAARKVVARLNGREATKSNQASASADFAKGTRDCVGLSILECCRKILAEDEECHFTDIGDKAVARGYSSNRGSSAESIRRSFLDMLRRNTDDFRLVGKGVYRLCHARVENSVDIPVTRQGKRYFVWGIPFNEILRWMGAEGWKYAEAKVIAKKLGIELNDNTGRKELNSGKRGDNGYSGPVPRLTDEHEKSLVALRD